jgi:hypothetical protein
MSKYTPGPWVISEEFTDSHDIVIDLGTDGSILVERHVEGKDAADMPNAKLVAAAPEMLDALKSACEFIQNTRPAGNCETRDGLISFIKSKIAKAEGAK